MNVASSPIFVRCHKTLPTGMQGDRTGSWYCSLPTKHDGMHVAHEGHQLDMDVAFRWYDHVIDEDQVP